MDKAVSTPSPGGGRSKAPGPSSWRRRLDIGLRVVAALGLGYVVAGLVAALLARLLPMATVEATTTGMLAAFAVYAGVAVWAFGDPKTWRVWAGLLGASILMGGVLWLSIQLEPRL